MTATEGLQELSMIPSMTLLLHWKTHQEDRTAVELGMIEMVSYSD